MTLTRHTPAGLPPFGMLLPAGWASFTPSIEDERALLQRIADRMKSAHRPDLHAELTGQVRRAFADLRRRDGVAMYLPSEVAGTGVPISITASVLTDPGGEALDGRLAEAIRAGGGFLDDQRTILRWKREPRSEGALTGLASTQLLYAIPVPGTRRTRALLFATVIMRDPAEAASGRDVETVELLGAVSDQIIGTFQWNPPSERSA